LFFYKVRNPHARASKSFCDVYTRVVLHFEILKNHFFPNARAREFLFPGAFLRVRFCVRPSVR